MTTAQVGVPNLDSVAIERNHEVAMFQAEWGVLHLHFSHMQDTGGPTTRQQCASKMPRLKTKEKQWGLSDEGPAHWNRGYVCLTQRVWLALPANQQREEREVIVSLCETVAALVETERVKICGVQLRRVQSLFGSRLVYIPGLLDVPQVFRAPLSLRDDGTLGGPTERVLQHIQSPPSPSQMDCGPWDLVSAVLHSAGVPPQNKQLWPLWGNVARDTPVLLLQGGQGDEPLIVAGVLRSQFRDQPCMDDWTILWPPPSSLVGMDGGGTVLLSGQTALTTGPLTWIDVHRDPVIQSLREWWAQGPKRGPAPVFPSVDREDSRPAEMVPLRRARCASSLHPQNGNRPFREKHKHSL